MIVVIVPLIISIDGTVHNQSVKCWKDWKSVTHVDWVLRAQNVLRCNVVFVGMFFPKAAGLGGMKKRPPGRVCST